MTEKVDKNGFTIFEILIVIGILGLIVALSSVALQSMYQDTGLKTSTNEIYRAFTDARNRTLASEGDTVYGVIVGTSSVTRFVGNTYNAGATTNRAFVFVAGVTATGSLVSNVTPITFTRLSGQPSSTGTIEIRNSTGSATNTLYIHMSGLVEY